ncbi:hypothetical protein AAFF_G00104850 [Aldrovandia affinis]|uniref:Uncharacterized protein n=1 Tax=Aldrovandia affinis TaxID=143900 RepID=A0AAD7WXS8_9TELE|nr:hypothetical protein AAFF_G00104850 [Aldrovandia affinis]
MSRLSSYPSEEARTGFQETPDVDPSASSHAARRIDKLAERLVSNSFEDQLACYLAPAGPPGAINTAPAEGSPSRPHSFGTFLNLPR